MRETLIGDNHIQFYTKNIYVYIYIFIYICICIYICIYINIYIALSRPISIGSTPRQRSGVEVKDMGPRSLIKRLE